MTIQTVQISNTFNEFRETTNLVIDEVNKLGDGTGNLVIDTITANTYVGVSSDLNIAGNTGSDVVSLTSETLTIVGSNGIATSVSSNTVSVNLSASGVGAGTYGSATQTPVLVVNEQGIVTSVSNVNTSTEMNIAGNTGSDTVSLLSETLNVVGTNGITTSVSSNTVSVNLGSSLSVNDLTLTGGTANTLVYLNPSKQLTTLSTLSFSGTNVGINNASPGAPLDVRGAIRLTGASTGYVGLQAASSGTNQTYTLPASDGLNGQVLQTNGVGSLSWVNQASGGGGGGGGSGTSTARTLFTATGGQTTFSVSYTVGQVDVYMNGSKLLANNDFTATDGTSIVLAAGATAGDIVEAVSYSSQWITSGTSLYYANGSVGVGTTSPASRLHVASANTAFAVGTIRLDGADSAGTVNAPVTINAVTQGGVGNGGSQLYFETRPENGSLTERMRLDSSGNLGLGVVPSAWRSGDRALDIGSTTSLVDAQSVNTRLYNNTFVAAGGTNTYKITAAASYYDQGGGVHRWFNAASGTSGNTISFTQAMTLDASGTFRVKGAGIAGSTDAVQFYGTAPASSMVLDGNGYLGIGTTTPAYRLDVRVAGLAAQFVATNGNSNQIGLSNAANAAFGFFMGSPSQGALQFSDHNGTERARINASGNLLVGTTSDPGGYNSKLVVEQVGSNTALMLNSSTGSTNTALVFRNSAVTGNAIISNVTGGVLQFNSDGNVIWNRPASGELMRLDTSGRLGIGITTPQSKLHVSSTANTAIWGSPGAGNENQIYGSLTVGDRGTSGGSFAVRTDSASSTYASGFGIDGTYNSGTGVSTINLKAFGVQATSYYSNMAFYTSNGAVISEGMRLNAFGNLGIGTSSPAAKLDVSGSQAGNIVAVSALDIDCSTGNYFTKTIAADSTFTFSNPPASRAYGFTLELTHTSGTVTWPGTVRWPANTAPTLTTGKTHLFVFVTDDTGSRWRGSSLVNYDN